MASMRVIVFQENSFWYAQALEHDICVRASDLKELQSRIKIALRLEEDETGGIARIAAAPKRFHDMWEGKAVDFQGGNGDEADIQFGMAA